MRSLRREWFNISRTDVFRVIPLGDVHLGAAACDEKLLRRVVKRIADDPMCYWIGLGDFCEFINVHDKRFDVGTLASWIQMSDLADLARVQRARFLEIVEPIASRCLGLAKGNHEDVIARKFERDIYSEIVVGVKEAGGFADDYPLALGFYGWLLLNFYRTETRNRVTRLKVNVHHGFVGGRLAGAKALNMQRWLWTHDCDLAIFGHSHNTSAQPEAVESVDRSGNIVIQVRRGCYAGTFLRTVNNDGPSTYSEKRGYFPLPMGGAEVILKPGAMERNDMVRVMV